jgi:hypothetical protein
MGKKTKTARAAFVHLGPAQTDEIRIFPPERSKSELRLIGNPF